MMNARIIPDRDPARIAVNLVLLDMNKENLARLVLVAEPDRMAVRSVGGSAERVLPVALAGLHRRLTIMTSPAPPEWLLFASRFFPLRLSSWLGDKFWRPKLQPSGEFEVRINDKPIRVLFSVVTNDQIELSIAAT